MVSAVSLIYFIFPFLTPTEKGFNSVVMLRLSNKKIKVCFKDAPL